MTDRKRARSDADRIEGFCDHIDAATSPTRPPLRSLAEWSGVTPLTLLRRFGDVDTLHRRIEVRRFMRRPLHGRVAFADRLDACRDRAEVAAAIDAAARDLFDPVARVGRSVRGHVIGGSIGDATLRAALGAMVGAERERLASAVAGLARFGAIPRSNPRIVAHLWLALAFGHGTFDRYPPRTQWSDTLRVYRNAARVLILGDASGDLPDEPPAPESCSPLPPPDPHEDPRAERLLVAAQNAMVERGEHRLNLNAIAAEAKVGIGLAYRWFDGLPGVIDAALARSFAVNPAPDAERFLLEPSRDRVALLAHARAATGVAFGQRRRYREGRSMLRGALFARPTLARIAAHANAVMTERIVALHERWAQDAGSEVDHRGSAYLAMALSDGLAYPDLAADEDFEDDLLAVVSWLFATLGRLSDEGMRMVPPMEAIAEPPLTALPNESEPPWLPRAPQRSKSTLRKAILAAAREATLREGARGLQVASVARAVDLPTPNVQYYFPTNEVLLTSLAGVLLEERWQRWKETLAQGGGKTPTRALLAIAADPTLARPLAVLRTAAGHLPVGDAIDANRTALLNAWADLSPPASNAERRRRSLALLLAEAIGVHQDDGVEYDEALAVAAALATNEGVA